MGISCVRRLHPCLAVSALHRAGRQSMVALWRSALQHARPCSTPLMPKLALLVVGLAAPSSSTGPSPTSQARQAPLEQLRSTCTTYNYSEGDLLKTLEVACSDKNSREYAGLYEFLLTLFVEVDEGC